MIAQLDLQSIDPNLLECHPEMWVTDSLASDQTRQWLIDSFIRISMKSKALSPMKMFWDVSNLK